MTPETLGFAPAESPVTAVSGPATSANDASRAKTGSAYPSRPIAPIFSKQHRTPAQHSVSITRQYLELAQLDPTELSTKVEDWPKIQFRGTTYVPENWFEGHSKRTSWVKNYGFYLVSLVNNKPGDFRWFCLQNNHRCNKSYSANSTGNAMDHLTKDHNISPSTDDNAEHPAKKRKTQHAPGQHQNVLEGIKKTKVSANKEPIAASTAALVRYNVVNWVLDANVSFSMVANKYFQRLSDLIADGKPPLLPTSHTTIRSWICERHDKVLGELKKEITAAVTPIHLSFDCWLSPSRSSFIAIVGHYVDASFRQKTRLLRVKHLRGKHRGAQELAPEILDVAAALEFKHKIGYFIADNEHSNDTCVAELISQLHPDLSARAQAKQKNHRRIRCLGHVINLVAKAILFGENKGALQQLANGSDEKVSREEEIALLKVWRKINAVGKLRSISYMIRSSPQRKEKFRDIVKGNVTEEDLDKFGDLNVDPVKGRLAIKGRLATKGYNDTRWNSVYFMIERAICLRDALDFQCKLWVDDKTLEAEDTLSNDDWEILECFLKVLGPLKSATKIYEGNGVTLPGCLSSLYTIRRKLHEQIAIHDTILPPPQHNHSPSRSPSPPPPVRPRRNPALPRNLIDFEVDLLPSQHRNHPQLSRSPSSSPEPVPPPPRRSVPFIAKSIRLGLKVLSEYIQEMELSSAYWCAMVLHPTYRTKYLDIYFGQAKRDEVLSALRRLFREQPCHLPAQQEAAADHQPSDARTEFLFGNDYVPPALGHDAVDEVNVYVNEPPFQVQDPIRWWKDNQGRFPRLSKLAITLLSIPGMSAECERVFSQAKLLLTSQRQSTSEAAVGEVLVGKHYLRAEEADGGEL